MNATHAGRTAHEPCGPWAWLGVALLFAVTAAIALSAASGGPERAPRPAVPAQRLADTGLYSDFAAGTIASGVLAFTPQYPLWTDGARKQRWIRLPDGEAVDASNPDVWRFPPGTKLWKEFSFGRRVETRTMELGADGRWVYATYLWNEDGSDAALAPEQGVRAACATELGTRHDIPSVADCRACHEGGSSPVLGFSALQLSSDRDPLAPHAERPAADSVDLDDLVRLGVVRNLPASLVETPPRIEAASRQERAALGYLHGNCASCHNARGSLASLGLELDYPLATAARRPAPAIRTTLGKSSRFQPAGESHLARIEGGSPERSTLVARLASRSPVAVMPPLGTRAVDEEALALVRDWITADFGNATSVERATARLESGTSKLTTRATNQNQEQPR